MKKETDNNKKQVYAYVSKECWKALKVQAMMKEISLYEEVGHVLEKGVKDYKEIKF